MDSNESPWVSIVIIFILGVTLQTWIPMRPLGYLFLSLGFLGVLTGILGVPRGILWVPWGDPWISIVIISILGVTFRFQ